MNKIDLVLFDCDGTLIDSEYVNNKSISEMIIGLGHKQFTLPYCIDYFAGCSVHDVINTLNRLGIEDHNAALEKMHQHAIGIARKELMAIKHVAETLEKITVPKCVVSNGENAIVREFLAITELAKFFKIDNIFTCELVKKAKPDPDLYLYAAKKMGNFSPERCLVVEDSVVGVTAAKRAVMNVIGFIGANHHHERSENLLLTAGAFTAVKNFSEILKYIN